MLRAASVSSIRNTRTPPWCRAKAQLNSAVRAIPTCGVPVGDGQKRATTWPGRRAVIGRAAAVRGAAGYVARPGWTACRSPRRSPTRSGRPRADRLRPACRSSMTSPGSRSMISLTNSISSPTPNTMSDVRPSCRTSPSTSVTIPRSDGSRSVSIHGPSGQNVLNDLPRVNCTSLRCRSRAVTSLAHGVAEDHRLGVLGANLAGRPADHHRELALVFDPVRRRRQQDRAPCGPITESTA